MSTWDEKAEDYASAHHTLEHQRLAYNMQRWAMFVKGARWQREQLLSEETVERAARALDPDAWEMSYEEFEREYGGFPGWSSQSQFRRRVRSMEKARAVLTAALGEEDR